MIQYSLGVTHEDVVVRASAFHFWEAITRGPIDLRDIHGRRLPRALRDIPLNGDGFVLPFCGRHTWQALSFLIVVTGCAVRYLRAQPAHFT